MKWVGPKNFDGKLKKNYSVKLYGILENYMEFWKIIWNSGKYFPHRSQISKNGIPQH
jgi:hypothetical protein